MDPDAGDWLSEDIGSEEVATSSGDAVHSGGESVTAGSAVSSIPTGPPVPNPYSHLLEVPHKKRKYTHWARNKHLQYRYNEEYSQVYYNDYIDYMDKRKQGIKRDVPRPQEWAERALKLYAREGERLSANDVAYWYTTKNQVKPTYSIFHPVHSKEYYDRQYKSILC